MITLSLNCPVAFVVGGAGFIGSNLVEKLLKKKVQVVALDNLSTGRMENLEEAGKNRAFHFLNFSIEKFEENNFPRLDYAFFVAGLSNEYLDGLKRFLDICKRHHPKVVLISSIELYDQVEGDFVQQKEAEKQLARYTLDHKINARIVRLSAVYGPRMRFEGDDPVMRLIRISVSGDLRKEAAPLDFTTRALYIDDATDLLIKAVMHGSTVKKIYDGASLYPLKITEIKQVLIDPLWYENKGFEPTQLPPWPTPNLVRTMKELSWHPNTSVVEAFKKTLGYFRDHPQLVLELEKTEVDNPVKAIPKEEKKSFWKEKEITEPPAQSVKKGWEAGKIKRYLAGLLIVGLVIYAILYPGLRMIFGLWSVPENLKSSRQALSQSDFELAQGKAFLAKGQIEEVQGTVSLLKLAKEMGVARSQLWVVDESLEALNQTTWSVIHLIGGTKALSEGLKAVAGQKIEPSAGETEMSEEQLIQSRFQTANLEFLQAEQKLGKTLAILDDPNYRSLLPAILKKKMEDIKKEAQQGVKQAELARVSAFLIPQLIWGEKKSYLVLLTDNTSLHPGGGVVKAYGELVFNKGRLISIETATNPPVQRAKEGGVLTNLRGANFEADFLTTARLAKEAYQKSSGAALEGVVTLDLDTLSKLLEVVGPLNLSSAEGEISSNNLVEKVLESERSEELLSGVLKTLLQRIFFLSDHNWPKFAQIINLGLESKGMMVYLSDPTLYSYIVANRWAGLMALQPKEKKGEREEFVALLETGLEENRSGYYFNRELSLHTTIDNTYKISHKLVLSFLDKGLKVSDNQTFKNKVKLYLPSGSRLTKVLWGEKDVAKQVSSFSDFGLAGYFLVLEIKEGEQKSLILEYQDFKPLSFEGEQVNYKVEVAKQPGAKINKFDYILDMPQSLRVKDGSVVEDKQGTFSYSGDLASDQILELVLEKI